MKRIACLALFLLSASVAAENFRLTWTSQDARSESAEAVCGLDSTALEPVGVGPAAGPIDFEITGNPGQRLACRVRTIVPCALHTPCGPTPWSDHAYYTFPSPVPEPEPEPTPTPGPDLRTPMGLGIQTR